MTRHRALLSVPLGLVLVATLVVLAVDRPLPRDPVYAVTQVQAGLAHHPSAWLGRTVRVRGVAVLCLSSDSQSDPAPCSHGRSTYLLDAGGTNEVLTLAWAGPDPLLALARRVPLLGDLLPAPQVLHWGALATYRVQLRAVPATVCGTPRCYEALLLDAVLGALGEE